jgi:peptide/nickel transport system ATP-binding protein
MSEATIDVTGKVTTPPPALEIRDLRVSFSRRGPDVPVLRGISLKIAAGEAYGIVGESGCGKTTLAMAMMRYLARNGKVDGGRVFVNGEDVLAMSEDRLRELRGTKLAMVYQDPSAALNPTLRVGDQIAEVYRFHGDISKAEALERARESLERVAMPDPAGMLRRYPFELSGGQQQRVVIAMALAGNPSLLVLDEPTTGLDATVEAEVLDLIEDLRGQIDAAVLLISHNLGLVARLCERVGVLYAGRVVEEGPALKLFTDPRHPYTMGLLRCVPRFGARKDKTSLLPIPGSVPPLGTAMPGCVFEGRCSLREDRCVQTEPDLYPWPGGPEAAAGDADGAMRHTRCYFPERVPDMVVAASGGRPLVERAEAPATILNIRDLSKQFRDGRRHIIAVDDVTVEVHAGETLGLVGESGSGKTTLAQCVVGLLEPNGGTMTYQEHPLAKRVARRPAPVRRGIQMVFQNPDATLNPSWSIRHILSRSVTRLAGLSGSERRARVDRLANLVHFEPRYLVSRPRELSGGQKQRVAIARAIAGSPGLVVCDEPASALDVSVQATILNLLDDLQRESGVAYIFISHDLAVVRYLADRIAVMYLAWLMELGSAEDVFTPPHHPYTEALTSAIPRLDFDHPVHRIPLHGTLPSLSDPPSGCRFQTRCPRKIGAICENEQPPWRDAGNDHRIRCHIPVDELRRLQEAHLQEEHLSAES